MQTLPSIQGPFPTSNPAGELKNENKPSPLEPTSIYGRDIDCERDRLEDLNPELYNRISWQDPSDDEVLHLLRRLVIKEKLILVDEEGMVDLTATSVLKTKDGKYVISNSRLI